MYLGIYLKKNNKTNKYKKTKQTKTGKKRKKKRRKKERNEQDFSLRKHPFLLALRRNGCFRRLTGLEPGTFNSL